MWLTYDALYIRWENQSVVVGAILKLARCPRGLWYDHDQVLSDRLTRNGFKLMKELWSSNPAGKGVFIRSVLKFQVRNISAHVTNIAAWELEGLD